MNVRHSHASGLTDSELTRWPFALDEKSRRTFPFSNFFQSKELRFVETATCWYGDEDSGRHFNRFAWNEWPTICKFVGQETVDALAHSKFESADNSRQNDLNSIGHSTECRNWMKLAVEGESNVLITKVKISSGNSERIGPCPPSPRGRDGHFQVATFQDLRNERKEIRGSHPTTSGRSATLTTRLSLIRIIGQLELRHRRFPVKATPAAIVVLSLRRSINCRHVNKLNCPKIVKKIYEIYDEIERNFYKILKFNSI